MSETISVPCHVIDNDCMLCPHFEPEVLYNEAIWENYQIIGRDLKFGCKNIHICQNIVNKLTNESKKVVKEGR